MPPHSRDPGRDPGHHPGSRPRGCAACVPLLLALLALLPGCTSGRDAARAQADTEAAAAAARLPLDLAAARLPDLAGGFARGGTTWHETERPGMGVAVNYTAPNRTAVATVSLYDRGRGAVPDNPDDPRIAAEFDLAVAEVMSLAETRTNHRMAEQERLELELPDQPGLRCARLDGAYGRQPVRTLVCLGGAGGRYLKLHVTAPIRQVRVVDPEPFVREVTAAVRNRQG
jgi:hypothetical protein